MRFRKITATKYIGTNGYYLHRCKDGSFAICKGSTMTKWGTGFKTVRTAENFLNNHDYIKATTETIPISNDDLEFLLDFYHFDKIDENKYETEGITLITNDNGTVTFITDNNEYSDLMMEEALEWLDGQIDETKILSSVIYRGTELRPIFAKRDRRSPREITKNLIRVKSSNVWSYGIEIKDDKGQVGDVYVQFKGPNGGPGDVYRYYDVPIRVWRQCVSSTSKGHAVWKYLRNNVYYSKLTGDKRGKLPNAINNW